jgi:hypothetical protein
MAKRKRATACRVFLSHSTRDRWISERMKESMQRRLLCFVNERLQAVPGGRSPDEIAALPVETRLALRNAWLEHPELTEAFVTENPAGLSEEQREMVRSWRHHIAGRFFVFRYLNPICLGPQRCSSNYLVEYPAFHLRKTDQGSHLIPPVCEPEHPHIRTLHHTAPLACETA